MRHGLAAAVATQHFLTRNRRYIGESQPKRPPKGTNAPPQGIRAAHVVHVHNRHHIHHILPPTAILLRRRGYQHRRQSLAQGDHSASMWRPRLLWPPCLTYVCDQHSPTSGKQGACAETNDAPQRDRWLPPPHPYPRKTRRRKKRRPVRPESPEPVRAFPPSVFDDKANGGDLGRSQSKRQVIGLRWGSRPLPLAGGTQTRRLNKRPDGNARRTGRSLAAGKSSPRKPSR
eukprot:COSAG01_NODE_1017_length_12107_cov_114.566372_12_plen_230_part_00